MCHHTRSVFYSKRNCKHFSDIQFNSNFLTLLDPVVPVAPMSSVDPCNPSPCGPNSLCQNVNGNPACTCMPDFVGSPPGCRPECTLQSECVTNQACLRGKCVDPCPGSCGSNAQCLVNNHVPICTCLEGFTGDPFVQCNWQPVQRKFAKKSFLYSSKLFLN